MNESEFFTIIGVLAAGVALATWARARFHTELTLWEHEAGLLFRHGKFVRKLGAGRHKLWGEGYELRRFDTRWNELAVVGQEILTADRVSVRLSAVAIYRVGDALAYHSVAQDAGRVLYGAVQLALRDLAASLEVEPLLERKADSGAELTERVAATAKELGLELREVALRDVTVGGELKGAFASVVLARAEAQAAVEKARGESAAIRTLANASRCFENNPHLLQLRYLKVLEDKGTSCGSTFVLGDPADWLRKNI